MNVSASRVRAKQCYVENGKSKIVKELVEWSNRTTTDLGATSIITQAALGHVVIQPMLILCSFQVFTFNQTLNTFLDEHRRRLESI